MKELKDSKYDHRLKLNKDNKYLRMVEFYKTDEKAKEAFSRPAFYVGKDNKNGK